MGTCMAAGPDTQLAFRISHGHAYGALFRHSELRLTHQSRDSGLDRLHRYHRSTRWHLGGNQPDSGTQGTGADLSLRKPA
jgi:hypothetical protein